MSLGLLVLILAIVLLVFGSRHNVGVYAGKRIEPQPVASDVIDLPDSEGGVEMADPDTGDFDLFAFSSDLEDEENAVYGLTEVDDWIL